MTLAKGYEGGFTSAVYVYGIVGKNTATVTVEVGVGEDDGICVVGSSKRNKGEPYDPTVGANLAMADAYEKAARLIRKQHTPKD